MTRISRISIKNVLGIEELEFKPGDVTLVTGGNATGKTSVVEALKAVVGGGHDATLLRKGATEGEVVLVMDDDTEVVKTIGPHRSRLDAKHPDFGKIGAPATWLKGIADAALLNPVDLIMEADPKKRLRLVLEAMPLELDIDALIKVTTVVHDENALGVTGHPLTILDDVRKHIFEERTYANRVAKEKKATIAELRKSVPAVREGDLAGALATARHERALAQQQLEQSEAQLQSDYLDMVESLRQDMEAAVEQARATYDEAVRTLSEKQAEAAAAGRRAREPLLAELTRQIGEIEALVEGEKLHDNTRAMIEQSQAQVDEAEKRAKALTAAITEVDAMVRGLADQIPVKGVTIADGALLIDGVPFERANHQRQVEVALQLAALRAGKLPLVCVDGMELMDPEHMTAFMEQLEASGLQAIVTRVTEGPLTVEVGS
jgi:recombinational DNA repair ATPase RecF